MGYLNTVMDIGLKALGTQQLSMNVASHNIANANTPGYNRQRAVTETTEPFYLGAQGFLGTGVHVSTIERLYDAFTTNQINLQMQSYGSAAAKHPVLRSAEMVFNEAAGDGLSRALSEFFNGWESLAGHPESGVQREAVLQTGRQLTAAFRRTHDQLSAVQMEAERALADTVNTINTLTAEIAILNGQIKGAEGGGVSANDFRDRRDFLVERLSEHIGINVFESGDGGLTILLAGGMALLESSTYNSLEAAGPSIRLIGGQGSAIDVTERLTGGRLGGLIRARNDHVQSYLDAVNDLAARVAVTVNGLHHGGFGLDGSTNNLFFQQLPLATGPAAENTGGAAIDSGVVSDPSALTADDYEIRFTAPGSYDVVNTTTDATVIAGAAYTSGGAITDVPGVTVVITDGASPPAAGDVFAVGIERDYVAGGLALSGAVSGSPNAIAAAGEDPLVVSGAGDNRVALAVAGLVNSQTMSGNTASFSEFYSSVLAKAGYDVRNAESDEGLFEFSLQELKNLRDSVSGVSIDEESLNLVKFQNAYAAAARLINTSVEMLDILMSIAR